MKITQAVSAAVIAVCMGSAFAAVPAPPTSNRQADTTWTGEGLERVEVRGLDRVFIRPGASLAAYSSVQLEPVSVAFRRDWGRSTAPGSRLRIREEDLQRIRQGLSELIKEQVRAELADGGYALVDAPGDDVLAVRLSIVNLHINAPDLNTPTRVRSYVTSVGEMTLVAELRDSVSGELLARILDRSVGRDFVQMRVVTRVDNVSEARTIARAWARALRNGLDNARATEH